MPNQFLFYFNRTQNFIVMKKLYPTPVATVYITALLLVTSLAGCGTSGTLMMKEGNEGDTKTPAGGIKSSSQLAGAPTSGSSASGNGSNALLNPLQGRCREILARYKEILPRDLGSQKQAILPKLVMNALVGKTWVKFDQKLEALEALLKDVASNCDENKMHSISVTIKEIFEVCRRNPHLYIDIEDMMKAVKEETMSLIKKSEKGTAVRKKMNHVFKLASRLHNVARYAHDVATANKKVSNALEACKEGGGNKLRKQRKQIEVLQLVPLLPLDELKCNAELLEFMKERLSSESLNLLFNEYKIEFYACKLGEAVKAFLGSKLGGQLVEHIIEALRNRSKDDVSTILKHMWSADPLYHTFGVSAEALEMIKKHCSNDQPIVRGLREWLRDIIKEDTRHLTLENIQVAFQGDELSEDALEQIVSYVEACPSLCKEDEKRVEEVVALLKLLFHKTHPRLLGTDDDRIDDRISYTCAVAEIYNCLQKLDKKYSSETANKTLDEIDKFIDAAGDEVQKDFKEYLKE